ncbi:protein kinase domain-containing protein [Jiangella asiatica]|uniref:Protein kinase domain-containing protein n=1 Tax=Jiangella asiatica TaxID=2530372 RepID=A0A4R5DN27_9ACTN|nr:protein kinase [Jiangella asiatica]TDE13470.1 hypothetical protein E1269_05400 [Jiangella asiatica]
MQGHEAPAGYTVTRRLGSDASSMVLAREDATGRQVTLRLVGQVGPQVRDRLRMAAHSLRAVDHPHVITFHDVVDGPAGVVVVLGAAEGGSLAGIIGARGVLPAGEVVTACAPVAEGLTELHRRGLIHGDLTLDDIVFSLDGRPMVAGVGLIQAGVPLRTGQHARPVPPEVQAGQPPGPPADVHGLVTAAVVALTGYLPASRLSLPGVAPAAQALLASALDPLPHRRPTASAVGNAFFAVADPVPVELVLEEGHATTTGSLRPVLDAPADDDIAAYMRRSTSAGRRARRRAEDAGDQEPGGPGGPGAAGAAPGAGPAAGPGVGPGADPAAAGGPMTGGAMGAAAGGAGGGVSPTAPTGPIPTSRRGRRARGGEPQPEAAPAGARDAEAPVPPSERRRGRRPSGAGVAGAGAGGADTGRGDAGGGRDAGGGEAVPVAREARRGRRHGDDGPEQREGKRRRIDGIWIASALVVLLLAAGAVLVGMRVFGEDDLTTGPGTGSSPTDANASTDLCGGPQPAPTTPPPTVADWTQEVQRLYSLRAQAFEEGDAELLCQVHAPSNPVLAEDAELLQEYADAGVHTEGLAFEVVNAELVSLDGGRATVQITQRIPDYQLVDDDGEVVQDIDGTGDEPWEAELVAVANEDGTSSWRFG